MFHFSRQTGQNRNISKSNDAPSSRSFKHRRAEKEVDEEDEQWKEGRKKGSTTTRKRQKDDGESLPVVYRWSPILSGILSPFGIMMEIPGLTEHWYVKTENHRPVVYQDNPVLLDVGLAFSMASAVFANICLIIRFMERRPRSFTLAAILFLTLHDVLNMIAIIWFAIIHSVDDGFTYGQSFYLTLVSTVISLIVNASLIVDAILYFRNAKGSGLTDKQRGVVICFMLYLIWLSFGAMCNVWLMDLSFQTSLYFTLTTIGTTGFGDFHPTTVASKIFSMFFDSIGIIMLAVLIAATRETVLETFEQSYRRRRKLLIAKAEERREARRQEPYNEGISEKVQNTALTALKSVLSLNLTSKKKCLTIPKEEREYQIFRREMEDEEKSEYMFKLGMSLLLFFFFWFIGTIVFHYTEHWGWFNSFWFCYVTFSTLGYGDFVPITPAGRAFFIAWAIFGISTLTILFSVCAEAWSARFKHKLNSTSIRRAFHRRRKSEKMMKGNSKSSRSEEEGEDEDEIVGEDRHPALKMLEATSKLGKSLEFLNPSFKGNKSKFIKPEKEDREDGEEDIFEESKGSKARIEKKKIEKSVELEASKSWQDIENLINELIQHAESCIKLSAHQDYEEGNERLRKSRRRLGEDE